MRLSSTVSTGRKSAARIPVAWACRNCRHVGPEGRGARPAASLESRGRSLASAGGAGAAPVPRATSGQPGRTGPGGHGGRAPRSRAGAPAVRQHSPGRGGTAGKLVIQVLSMAVTQSGLTIRHRRQSATTARADSRYATATLTLLSPQGIATQAAAWVAPLTQMLPVTSK